MTGHTASTVGKKQRERRMLSSLFPFYLVLDLNSAEGTACIYSRSSHFNELTEGTSSEICSGMHFHGDSKFFHIDNEE